MESSHVPSHFPKEMIDRIFSNTDAKTVKTLLGLNKKYSTSKDLWQKMLPEGFPIPQNVNARTYVFSRIIRNGEEGVLPKTEDFFLNLKMNENSKLQIAFMKTNATYEECFVNPSVELGIEFKNSKNENQVERYLFSKEFVPSGIIDHTSTHHLKNLSVTSIYFPPNRLPPSIMEMNERANKYLLEYVEKHTTIDITLAKTNPGQFTKAIFEAGILNKINEYIKKSMPNEETKGSKIFGEKYRKLVTEKVLKLDKELSMANPPK